MLVLTLSLKVAALWSSRTGGVIPAHGQGSRTVWLLIFPVCMCLPDFPFPPCLTVCGPVLDDLPWWHPFWFIWSLCDSLSDSLYLAVCSRHSDSVCLWRSMAMIRTYIYHFYFLSVPLAVSVMLLFALHNLWICALLSPCDCLWQWQARLILCASVTGCYSVPLSSVGGVISDSFAAPRLFRESDTRGAATFIYVHCFPLFLSCFPELRGGGSWSQSRTLLKHGY